MSKNEVFNIIIFGDLTAVTKFSEYLGFEIKSKSAIVYFEFPNEKFKRKKFIKLFKHRLKFYVLQPNLLTSSLIVPKKQFKDADVLIILPNNSNDSLYAECYDYLKNFIQIRKSFIPSLLIGYSEKENLDINLEKSYRNLEFCNTLKKIFGTGVEYLELNQNQNEALFFIRIREIIEKSSGKLLKEFSTISIEQMIEELESTIEIMKNQEYDHELGVKLIAAYENQENTITRRLLVNKWGFQNKNARFLINYWENRPNLNKIRDKNRELLENDSILKYEKCSQLKLDTNLCNLLALGYNLSESKITLSILKEMDLINSISYHIPPKFYEIYDNLQELIIISGGRTIYIRTDDPNHDQATLFSGLIQTIEIIRDRYMSQKVDNSNKNNWFQVSPVDFLDFGTLHAIIGKGKDDLKVILRFKNRPQTTYIEKTSSFLTEFEKNFEFLNDTRLIDLDKIRPEIDRMFFEFYSPFPKKFSMNKAIRVNLEDKNSIILSDVENSIIEIVKQYNGITIKEILSQISDQNNNFLSESDLFQVIFDLLGEKLLI